MPPLLQYIANGTLSDASQLDQYYNLFKGNHVYDVANVYGQTSTAIQNAVNDAQATGKGGLIWLGPGNFTMTSTVQISGDGICVMGIRGHPDHSDTGTQLNVQAGFSGTEVIRVAQLGTPTIGTRPLTGITLRDFTIDGNLNTGSNIDGIYFQAYASLIDDVYVQAVSGNGIHVQGLSAAQIGGNGWNTYDTKLVNLWTEYCTGHGVFLDNNANDCKLFNITTCYNGGNGFHVTVGGTDIETGHTFSNQGHGAYFGPGVTSSSFLGCYSENNFKAGIFCDQSSSQGVSILRIGNCKIWANSGAGDNTWDNIQCGTINSTGWTEVLITGNDLDAGTQAIRPRYNVNFGSVAVNSSICAFNIFNNPARAGNVNAAGATGAATFCLFQGNYGYNPVGSVTAPTITASVYTVTNPFNFNCNVYLKTPAGVTVSVITIAGVNTGLTMAVSSFLTLRVMAGQAISLTYAGGTPTWTWYGE